MNVIESRWRERRSRVEDGIFFGSGDFLEMSGSPECGYSAGTRFDAGALIAGSPDDWCDLTEQAACHVKIGDLAVFGGATSSEGEGFIAVEEDSKLLWILHLTVSEEFVTVASDGTSIVAFSGGYPDRFEWRIPIESPGSLALRRVVA